MTVFKAFLQILNRNKVILIVYSLMLVFFSIFSVKSNQTTAVFESTKPDVCIMNRDLDQGITASLVDYLAAENHLVSLPDNPDARSDALFYREVNLIIEIPENFHADFLAGKNPEITTQSTGDYNASLAQMSLERYLETAGAYRLVDQREADLIHDIEATLSDPVSVELVSGRDLGSLNRASFYFNFMNYSLIVGCVFIICLALLSFRNQKIADRIAVSSTNPERVNRILLGANLLFASALWLVYVVIAFVVVGGAMFSLQGLLLMLNSFVFVFCVVALALLIARLVKSPNALNGIVNVIGLGSSFLCGVFVPLEWLPDFVVALAHALPSYWYVDANDRISKLETISGSSLAPIFLNLLVVILFALGFIIATSILSHRRRKD